METRLLLLLLFGLFLSIPYRRRCTACLPQCAFDTREQISSTGCGWHYFVPGLTSFLLSPAFFCFASSPHNRNRRFPIDQNDGNPMGSSNSNRDDDLLGRRPLKMPQLYRTGAKISSFCTREQPPKSIALIMRTGKEWNGCAFVQVLISKRFALTAIQCACLATPNYRSFGLREEDFSW